MRKHNGAMLAIFAGIIILGLTFVSSRSRSFHYCVGNEDGALAHAVSGAEPCAPGEKPMDWRSEGWRSKFNVLATTTAKAFGTN